MIREDRRDRIRPLVTSHGANDPRVPIGETEQIVEALRAKGREVEYLRYEDEGHGLAKTKNRARRMGNGSSIGRQLPNGFTLCSRYSFIISCCSFCGSSLCSF